MNDDPPPDPNPDENGHIWDGPCYTLVAVRVRTCSRCRCDPSDWQATYRCGVEWGGEEWTRQRDQQSKPRHLGRIIYGPEGSGWWEYES